MPCYQVRVQRVEFRAERLDLLKKSLESLGLKVVQFEQTLSWYEGGRAVSFSDNQLRAPVGVDLDRYKRAYSEIIVKEAAKKRGWQVKKIADNHLQVVKRSY